MSSSIALDIPAKYIAPPQTAVVDHIASVPEYGEWSRIAQKEKTQIYGVSDTTGYSLLSVKINTQRSATDYSTLEHHIKEYLDEAYFVDSSIAQLISDNIDDLF